jgi:hypothetical protein
LIIDYVAFQLPSKNIKTTHFLDGILRISMTFVLNNSMTFVPSCEWIFGKLNALNFSEWTEPL